MKDEDVFLIFCYMVIIAIAVALLEFLFDHLVEIIGIIIFIALLYGLYHVFGAAVKDFFKTKLGVLGLKIDNFFLEKKIKKQKLMSEEKARAEAIVESTKLFEDAIATSNSETLKNALEALRSEAEIEIFKAKIKQSKELSKKYEDAIAEINGMENLSEEEKLQLYKKLIDVSR